MAILQIYFNDALKSIFELKSAATSIGRAADNDIVIDNPGVSGHHARIVQENGHYSIEDNFSKNGVFVNGKRIDQQILNYGDTIIIFKHQLKFSAMGSNESISDSVSQDTHAVARDATVMVNVANLRELLKESQSEKAYLLTMNKSQASIKLMLSKISFSLGKSAFADLRVGGWFAPKVAAKIVRHSDGYYLTPGKSGKVSLNGSSISKPAKLRNEDEFLVRGTALKFFDRQAS